MHTTKHIPKLFFCFLLSSCFLFADYDPDAQHPAAPTSATQNTVQKAPSSAPKTTCSCGCKCPFECTCGCTQGKVCDCVRDLQSGRNTPAPAVKPSPSLNCPCAFDCSCAGAQGGRCDCPGNYQPAGYTPYNQEPQYSYGYANPGPYEFQYAPEYAYAPQDYDGEYTGQYTGSCNRDTLYPYYETPTGCGWWRGIWLPCDPPLFRPFMADPREICYSAGWRFNDQALVKNVIDVSYGDIIPFYRFTDICIGPFRGQLEFELEGGMWAVFDPLYDSSPLIDADYFIGFPIVFASGNWQFRLRGYHISTHIGDEYLLNHPHFKRKNPSAEYLDFYVSNYFSDDIRYYGGVGYVVAMDDSFKIGRFYAEAGMEVRLHELGFVNECQQLYGAPIFGMDFHYDSKFNKHVNQTYVLGYEFGKLCGLQRRLRFFMEYHDGYSVDGQFQKYHTNYFSIRASYGF